LTAKIFAATLTRMDEISSTALASLERKIAAMLDSHAGLRAENLALREHIATLEARNQTLNEKIDAACDRLEGLMAKIP